MKMDYKEAKKIRKEGILGHFQDRMLNNPNESTFTSARKAVSEKTKARMMGMTQYMDPMYLARFLTFGHSVGSSIYGKAMGRSKEDIEYFTNRKAKKDKTPDKISAIENAQTREVLVKIYDIISEAYEREKLQNELANSHVEESDMKEEKRNKELVKALAYKPSATVINGAGSADETPFEKMKRWVETIIGSVKLGAEALVGSAMAWISKKFFSIVTTLTSWTKTLVSTLGRTIFKAFTLFKEGILPAIRFISNPLVISGILAALALNSYEKWGQTINGLKAQINTSDTKLASLKNQLDYLSPKLGAGQDNPEYTKKKKLFEEETGRKQLLVRKKETLEANPPKEEDDKSLWENTKDYFTQSTGLDNIEKMFKEMKTDIDFGDTKPPEFKWPEMPSNISPEKNNPLETTVPAISAEDTAKKSRADFARNDPRLIMASTAVDTTNRLESATTENKESKRPKPVDTSPKVVNNTTTTNSPIKTAPVKRSLPSVRNDEESFQEIIFSLTRVV